MKESIYISNYGPIIDAKIDDIKRFTVFIGESGSGKSTIMKVLSLFQWIYKMMCIRSFLYYSGIKKSPFRFTIKSYFQNDGLDDYLQSDTIIIYKNGYCTLEYKNGKLSGTTSYVPKNELSLEKVSFISDKRNLIPDILENHVSIKKRMFYLSETLDDYLKATEYIKELDIKYLGVKFVLKKTPQGNKHTIQPICETNRYSIKLNEASSGTQTLIPLSLIIEYFSQHYDLVDSMNKAILSYVSKADRLTDFKAVSNIGAFPNKNVHLFVEEPELSLFPSSQRDLLDFMANRCFVDNVKDYHISLMLATHSPYIINHLNVLLRRSGKNHSSYIDGNDLAVYRVYDGKLQNLMMNDDTSGEWIVNTNDLSEVMSDIYNEYVSLTDSIN